MSPNSTHSVALTAPRHLITPRRLVFWPLAVAFPVTMLGTALPTPALIITVIFAVYSAGALAGVVHRRLASFSGLAKSDAHLRSADSASQRNCC